MFPAQTTCNRPCFEIPNPSPQSYVVNTYGISWADALVMGGIAATHYLNAPNTAAPITFNVTFGRCDRNTVNPPNVCWERSFIS